MFQTNLKTVVGANVGTTAYGYTRKLIMIRIEGTDNADRSARAERLKSSDSVVKPVVIRPRGRRLS